MAWTAPRTWTVGDIVTASMMNANVRDNMLHLGPLVRCKQSSGETNPGGSWTAVAGMTLAIPANGLYDFMWGFEAYVQGAASILLSPSGAGFTVGDVVAKLDGTADSENGSVNVFIRPRVNVMNFYPTFSALAGTLTFMAQSSGTATIKNGWGRAQGTS